MDNKLKSLEKEISFNELTQSLEGEFHTDSLLRKLYSTDASEYQEMPLAVAFPKSESDIKKLILFSNKHHLSLIPRTAGTSLAGQVVGSGIVMDLGRHLNKIISIDSKRQRTCVQPGVIRNDLNAALHPYGLLFGPETSTANRAMIGGMVGNNSCGSNSIVYQSTREHLIATRGYLSDGSEVTFCPLTADEFNAKCEATDSLETRIYRGIRDMLSSAENRYAIEQGFPKKSITRRNTGYALDLLMDANVFDASSDKPFNLCKLIAGSEGTLFVGVEFEIHCDPLPHEGAVMCAHFSSVIESLHANLIALKHNPSASELIDKYILDCTKQNIQQRKNRFFVEGDPGAILVIEIRRKDKSQIEATMKALEADMRSANLGYSYPVLWGNDVDKVWDLRRAGQGVMTNVVGDTRPAEIVEDTAVDVQDLPAYITEFDALMKNKYNISCVYYAHAGSGELHTRPLINLKTEAGHKMFRSIAEDIATLVKKYQGSLSGEHGDGRLRGEFIRFMTGDLCYNLMCQVKALFDPNQILNRGKITDTPPMDAFHRYEPGHPTPEYETIFDFSNVMGILRAAEKCNGSGDCRKTVIAGGTMCPSYMATRDEKNTTRGRANILRHLLTHPLNPKKPFVSDEIKEIMDLCLSCKGCKSECPSNVDITKMKAEFLQHYYDAKGIPLRSRMISHFADSARIASLAPWIWNLIFATPSLRSLANSIVGFHPKRTIPLLNTIPVKTWFHKREKSLEGHYKKRVFLFCDEFTNYNELKLGIAAVELLEILGYHVSIPNHVESGRASLSKGLLYRARKFAQKNVDLLSHIISEENPLIGIEPSAILCFRDEYPDLLRGEAQEKAKTLGKHCLLFDEFIANEMDAGRITSQQFKEQNRLIHLHGHCQQKAIASLTPTVKMLQLPKGHQVRLIPSGCCGMAGSFGYEKEHYELSQKIGELILFPKIRNTHSNDLIAATGTSCRHQIHDGTGRKAMHPIQILRDALQEK